MTKLLCGIASGTVLLSVYFYRGFLQASFDLPSAAFVATASNSQRDLHAGLQQVRQAAADQVQQEIQQALQQNAQSAMKQAQANFANCIRRPTRQMKDRYIVWSSPHALGNSLNVFMHSFLYSLVSGRQLLVGSGTSPELLCGRIGAFLCGVAFHEDLPNFSAKGVSHIRLHDWGLVHNSSAIVHFASYRWIMYPAWSEKGGQGFYEGVLVSSHQRQAVQRCVLRALRCGEGSDINASGKTWNWKVNNPMPAPPILTPPPHTHHQGPRGAHGCK